LTIGLLTPISAQTTQLLSRNTAGVLGNADSLSCSVSADGRFVAFGSRATNLLAVPDANGSHYDIFVRDRWGGTTEIVSQSTAGVQGNDDSYSPHISADGRFVVFVSRSTNLVATGDANGASFDVFLRDRWNGTTELASVSSAGIQGNDESNYAAISADGRFVSFASKATNLVAPDGNLFRFDVFVRDRLNGTTEIVSLSSAGAQGNGNSILSAITPDGRYLAFQSGATNLVAGGDPNGPAYDIFVRDRVNGTTELVSQSSEGTHGNDYCYNAPAITPDGRFVAFSSRSTNLLDTIDSNSGDDIFLRDRWNGTTELVSLSTAGVQQRANSLYGPSISSDGRFVAFSSSATNLTSQPDANAGLSDVFLRDRLFGTTELLSLSSAGVQGDGNSYEPLLTPDARFVAYWSYAANLVPGDVNAAWDIFVRDTDSTSFTQACDPSVAGAHACPCSNPPAGPGRGCDNSAATGGASLTASGAAHFSHDTLTFATSGEKPIALSVLLQGNGVAPNGAVFGQGVSCVGGTILRRLYYKNASAGSITAPNISAGDRTVSAQSAFMGDLIQAGESRWYLVYYRDGIVLGGCPASSMFNATPSGQVVWSF
jgi:Tol biopolymer transport system component